ncbi:FGGY-family carbohydrate kinase [Microcoleus sp. FACHB-672]|uniref:FGGY-family carbohydrate kinase n=1 Tax=Microcoleus sp. FACHB-672 TaxID=2692825 RepID=UPI00168497F4|nr:FGGY-family carbohydrate kinase [Microcoleus sp. FACHB-672]MBD2043716.1 FGGY-family carbohydrate kinase [Microcoleus sp. FACHB-672]
MNFYLGIDFGTTGARAVAIDAAGTLHAEAQYPFNATSDLQNHLPDLWQTALFTLISQIPQEICRDLRAIAINGTSSTVLLCDAGGKPIAEPLLYNDGRGVAVMQELKTIAPANHPVISATSSLAKLLWFRHKLNLPLQKHYFLHQADWLAFLLHNRLGISDYHNALKLGYDPERLCYPNWLLDIKSIPHLPEIVKPGMPVGEITAEIAQQFGLPADCQVCAGTTDSIAAFLASGVQSPGEAVTSLGSTLVLKLLSRTRIDDARYGIYSHRLEDLWLVGGASNTGGAVLRQFFTDTELESLSRQIDPEQESPLDYYPLIKAGDRFPINDPNLPPRLEPRPDNPVEFLHGLLESIARIEAQAYQLLQELGTTKLTHVYTAGGGAKNPVWSAIRERLLNVPVGVPAHTEAAYGTALLAMRQLTQ